MAKLPAIYLSSAYNMGGLDLVRHLDFQDGACWVAPVQLNQSTPEPIDRVGSTVIRNFCARSVCEGQLRQHCGGFKGHVSRATGNLLLGLMNIIRLMASERKMSANSKEAPK